MKEELKKLIEKAGTLKLLAVVICGVLLLFFSYSENADEKAAAPASSSEVTDAETKGTLEEYKAEREEELKQLTAGGRSRACGCNDYFEGVNEKVTLNDNTQKGESNEEKTVLVENSSRDSSPYIIQEKEPEIEGIVIVCEGGYDSVIKREITDAVSALFSIESHKIKIMKSKEAKE